MKRLPQVTVSLLVRILTLTAPTVRNSLNYMVKLGILEEVGNKNRNKVYVYRKYLDILEGGGESFPIRSK
jgi:Fic family protein